MFFEDFDKKFQKFLKGNKTMFRCRILRVILHKIQYPSTIEQLIRVNFSI
jgi:hypothetical protein